MIRMNLLAASLAGVLAILVPAAPVYPAPPARVDAAALQAALAPAVERAAANGFSGAVLVANGERVLFERAVGVADPRSGAAIADDTRFNLGSTGKLFTTVAVLQLVERGKLDLDAPIGRYLPHWPVASVREKVTPRMLLQHTSGLGAFWGEAFEARRAELRRLRDYQPLLTQEPAFEPGSAWRYSNTGYMLLGLVIEAVSGEDYYDYVARHVFAPAGMRDTGYFEPDGRADRVARPHAGGSGEDARRTLPMPEPRGGAAGGGYSTPRDLLRFHRALLGGKLLGAKTLDLLFAPVALPGEDGRRPPHGLGMLRYDTAAGTVYGHPGGAPGVSVEFRGARESGWAVIVMGNANALRATPVAQDVMAAIAASGGPDLRGNLRMQPR
ncbi:MAG TPA: serine hydrolase domain-containing protein [Lysobacter sp.]|nr:serine hydrolase domain-containing protein [Lysobacter sp.]